jgi:hypothetical protein
VTATGQCLRSAPDLVLERALELWREDIIDPRPDDESEAAVRSRSAITSMIHVGLVWAWEPPYAGDGSFSWCGAYAATCWADAGLHPLARKKHLASTYRLRMWSQNTERRVQLAQVRAGDILIVGHRDPVNGDHIALAVGAQLGGMWPTVEGNALGKGPDGTYREGVVRRDRGPADVRYAVRPLPEDLA